MKRKIEQIKFGYIKLKLPIRHPCGDSEWNVWGEAKMGEKNLGSISSYIEFKILEWMKESVHTKDGPRLRLKEDNTYRS